MYNKYNFDFELKKKKKKSNNNIIILFLCICFFLIIIIFIGIFIYFYYINKNKNKTPSITNTKTTTNTANDTTTTNTTTSLTDKAKADEAKAKAENAVTEVKESKSILEKINDDPIVKAIGNILQDPHLYESIAVQIGMVEAVKLAVSKTKRDIAQAVVKKALLKSTQVIMKTMESSAAKLGWKAGERALAKAATGVAAKIGEQAAIAATTGPGAPFVEAAFLAFDVLSIGLDLGDAGGYGKMGQKSEYINIRDGINKKMKEEIENTGNYYPIIVGPLDKLTEDDYSKALNDIITNILDVEKVPMDDLVKPMFNKLIDDVKNKIISSADLKNPDIMKTYNDLIDQDQVTEKALSILCTSLKGKLINNGDTTLKCSYPDRDSCEKSYSWPLKEDSNEAYAEFKSNQLGGACVRSSFAIRGMCQDNNLQYDSDKGICNITEEYCLMKGAKWTYDDSIKENDCHIEDGQKLAEMIFGTTITRGLIQIFDPNQYEPCNDGETDDGYFCRSVGCNNDEDHCNNAGICYPKCEDGYHNSTCFTCISNCPEGYVNSGVATCSKGGEVYAKSTYPIKKSPCDNGQRDDGTSCWEDLKTDCSWGGWHNTVLNCNTTGCGCIKKTLMDRAYCDPGDKNVGGICYPNCNDGYVDDGAFCRRPIETVGRTTKGLGAGRPAVKIRAKKRRIPFSTKDN